MARNGSGVYSVPNTFNPGDTISSADHNQNFDDLGDEITNSVAADGQTTMTGPLKAANGTAGAPSITFGSDPDSGLFRASANSVGLSVGGSQVADFGSQVELKVPFLASATATFAAAVIMSATASFSAGFVASATATFASRAIVSDLVASGTASFINGFIASATSTFATGLVVTNGALTVTAGTVSLPSGSIQASALPAGSVVQVVNSQTGNVSSTTTVMPNDDTIPQNTEGSEFMSLGITPTSASNKLKIDVVFNFTANGATTVQCALFQDNVSNALAAVSEYSAASSEAKRAVFTHFMTAGTTSGITFKVRAGPSASAQITFNGVAAARTLGGVYASSITITEIKV